MRRSLKNSGCALNAETNTNKSLRFKVIQRLNFFYRNVNPLFIILNYKL